MRGENMPIQIYGKNSAIEVLKSSKTVLKAYVLEGSMPEYQALLKPRNMPIEVLPKGKFIKQFEGNHQGIVLEIPDYPLLSLEEYLVTTKDIAQPLLVILDGIEDPHNLGAIIRSGEAAGVSGIVIPKNRAAGVTGTVVKVASGAMEHIRLVEVVNITQTIEKLKKSGYWIVGTSIDASTPYTQIAVDTKLAIVIGSEGKGLSRLVKESVDYNVIIPMVGKANSLNASVSAAILMFDILRRRTIQ
jgi:23S rRNA (guanosine2251-2'-O)-methyltransferase